MLTVLIVEDDESNRRALEKLLRKEGYAVCMPVAEPFAAGAFKLLETERIDAVILDLSLGPGFDGFDVARRMRDHPAWQRIPVFISSGLSEAEIAERAREYAFHGMRTRNVGKPLDVHMLLGELRGLTGLKP